MGLIKTAKGWGKQLEGIWDGDIDKVMEGLADEAIGLAGSVAKMICGAPDVDTDED